MNRSDELRLEDILGACEEVAAIVGRGKENVASDAVARRALERLLEIVGESAGALTVQARAGFDVPWKDVIGLRNVIAHHYHRVDHALVWEVAAVDLPRLALTLRGKPDTSVAGPR